MIAAALQLLTQNGPMGAVAVLFFVLYVRKDRQVERTYATLLAKVMEVTTAWKDMSQEMEKLLRERQHIDSSRLNGVNPPDDDDDGGASNAPASED